MVYISELVGARQVVLITSRAEAEILGKRVTKDNVMTADWHSPLSFKPLLYGIVIGVARYSLRLIKKSKVFCVNFVPYKMRKKAVECGSYSGEHLDKFAKFGLEKAECNRIDCPRLKGASAWLECEVVNELETGDHVLFVGKVVNSGVREAGKRLYHITADKFTTTK